MAEADGTVGFGLAGDVGRIASAAERQAKAAEAGCSLLLELVKGLDDVRQSLVAQNSLLDKIAAALVDPVTGVRVQPNPPTSH